MHSRTVVIVAFAIAVLVVLVIPGVMRYFEADNVVKVSKGGLTILTIIDSQTSGSDTLEKKENMSEFLTRMDELSQGDDKSRESAYSQLSQRSSKVANDSNLLWRLARAQYQLAVILGASQDKKDMQKYLKLGISTASRSLDIDEKSDKAHKWYALLVGRYTDFQGAKEKIQSGYTYEKHMKRAVELNPKDPFNISLLGRFCYEVAILSWWKRRAAAALFREPPKCTVDEALASFKKAEKLQPGFWIENSLFLGKCYYEKSAYKEAKVWFQKAISMKATSPDDEKAQQEAHTWIDKY